MEQIFNQLSNNYDPYLVANLKSINENLSLMKISELWNMINQKKTTIRTLQKTEEIQENQDGGMQEESSSVAQQEPIKYVSNILDVLQSVKFKLSGIEASKLNQLYAGVYEGGFQLWECERDIVEFLFYSSWLMEKMKNNYNINILEIGCGSGLAGVLLLQMVGSYFNQF